MKTKTKKWIAGSILITTLVVFVWFPVIVWLLDKYLYDYIASLVFPVQWSIIVVIAGIAAVTNNWAVQVLIDENK